MALMAATLSFSLNPRRIPAVWSRCTDVTASRPTEVRRSEDGLPLMAIAVVLVIPACGSEAPLVARRLRGCATASRRAGVATFAQSRLRH
jgi:hypothetical protein